MTEEIVEAEAPDTEARVAKYGCLGPIEGREHVEKQLRAAAKYYNDLIALERCRRATYRELRRKHVNLEPAEEKVRILDEELKGIRIEIKNKRSAVRGRANTRELDERAKTVGQDLKKAREELKLARHNARENVAFQAAVAEMDQRARTWAKGLRACTEAFWGTYIMIEAAAEQASKSIVDPSFRRAYGRERTSRTGEGPAEGRLGVQIQGGIPMSEVLAGRDTRVRLIDTDAFKRNRTSERGLRRCATKLLYLRVASEGRAPVWAVLPVIYHRPLPDDALVKSVSITLRVVASREQWFVHFTYRRKVPPRTQNPGTVAIDLGWRKRPDESLRAAYWVDDQGEHGEILMPQRYRNCLMKARWLQEIQDRYMNRATRWVARWLDKVDYAPEWLTRNKSHIHQWRSHARLRRLVFHWRDNRFEGDEGLFLPLERWLHRSRHLWSYQEGLRAQALRGRKETYRLIGAQFAKKYGTVVLEQFDLAKAKRLKAPESGADAPKAQRAQLHVSAPGELRQTIAQAVQREGGLVVSLNAAGTTNHCNACGAECAWDQGEELWHTCEHCGALWDQDHNAAINLLRTFTQAPTEAIDLTRKPKKTRFANKRKNQQAATGT